MASLVKRFLEEENLKMTTRLNPGNLYICHEDWDYGGPFIITGSVLLVIYTFLVWRLYSKLDRNRKLFDHIYFRTTLGFGLGVLLMMSFALVSLGIFQYNFLYGLYFILVLPIPVFFLFAQWLRRDMTKHTIVGEIVEVDVEDYYQDFQNTSKFSVSMCAFVQFILIGITLGALFTGHSTDGPPLCLSNMSIYLLGVVIQWLYLYHYLIWSMRRQAKFWYNIISKDQDCIFICLTHTDNKDGQWKKITRDEINYRKCLHIFINGLCTLWILVLVPIHLAAAEQLQDIVLNMVALYFITELDDLKDGNSMVVSTNPDRFVKTPGTYGYFYTWHSEQESAQEVRGKHFLPDRKGIRYHSINYANRMSITNATTTNATTTNATPTNATARVSKRNSGDGDSSGNSVSEW
eukprot:CAMPEP_0194238834 /NCGR_PEP_ID=MMETSP0158-20130606/5476_1 /TAXON_ID=33649 /ORGANISM="Thalassionema nitzschioides, Strain L26-B" /LENGTH=405 /DNA_ID=CAMNT_0038973177 /DNA_START=1 /DNA_END=1215 /DNA_ORIENTATION=-